MLKNKSFGEICIGDHPGLIRRRLIEDKFAIISLSQSCNIAIPVNRRAPHFSCYVIHSATRARQAEEGISKQLRTAGQFNREPAGQFNHEPASLIASLLAGLFNCEPAGQFNREPAGQFNREPTSRPV